VLVAQSQPTCPAENGGVTGAFAEKRQSETAWERKKWANCVSFKLFTDI
jgi:hypothetical protein